MTRLVLLMLLLLPVTASAAPYVKVADGLVGGVIAAPDASFAVYDRRDGQIVVHPELGSPRTFAAPGCSSAAASRNKVALACGPDPERRQVQVLDVGTGVITPIDTTRVRGTIRVILGVGDRWVHVETLVDSIKTFTGQSLVDLETGAVIDLQDDPFGARRTLELDRARPSRALCAGARRFSNFGGATYELARFARATAIGRWVLAAKSLEASVLTDCRTGRDRRAAPASIINAKFVARADAGGFVAVRELATGRRQTLANLSGPQAALSANTVWASTRDGILVRRRLTLPRSATDVARLAANPLIHGATSRRPPGSRARRG